MEVLIFLYNKLMKEKSEVGSDKNSNKTRKEEDKDYTVDTYKERREPGEKAWFEYHREESRKPPDAELWSYSHQQVTIVIEGAAEGEKRGWTWRNEPIWVVQQHTK